MKKFTIRKVSQINAHKESVWRVLLTPEMFSKWASAFCPDSKMEGEWKEGGTITYTDDKGMGLKCKVVDFVPFTRATVQYVAGFENFEESSDKEGGWIDLRETYTLSEKNGVTTLSIESEVPSIEFYDEMIDSWDGALSKIKELSEKLHRSDSTKIFVNVAVKDLEKSKNFFVQLGYSIDPQFTDEKAACVVISKSIYVMLLVSDFFSTFTRKEICDAATQTEAIFALTAESRKEVDALAQKAVDAGGKIHREPEDHGWMYGQCFEDLDGHLWEIYWMDPSKKAGD